MCCSGTVSRLTNLFEVVWLLGFKEELADAADAEGVIGGIGGACDFYAVFVDERGEALAVVDVPAQLGEERGVAIPFSPKNFGAFLRRIPRLERDTGPVGRAEHDNQATMKGKTMKIEPSQIAPLILAAALCGTARGQLTVLHDFTPAMDGSHPNGVSVQGGTF